MARAATTQVLVHERRGDRLVSRPDQLAIEEPLEIRVRPGPDRDGRRLEPATLSVTMRTPGHDFELVAGFLFAEGVVSSRADLHKVAYCLDRSLEPEQRYNVVTAELTGPARRLGLERHVVTSSACGVCGAASIDAIRAVGLPELGKGPILNLDFLAELPEKLATAQHAFDETGGVHGAALVDVHGDILVAREDVGRHNAVDKAVGRALLDGRVPLRDTTLVVSGRVSFEIVQKALRAGIAVIAAVSAATSLAVRLAREADCTLVGFVRGDRCTVYSGAERLRNDVGGGSTDS